MRSGWWANRPAPVWRGCPIGTHTPGVRWATWMVPPFSSPATLAISLAAISVQAMRSAPPMEVIEGAAAFCVDVVRIAPPIGAPHDDPSKHLTYTSPPGRLGRFGGVSHHVAHGVVPLATICGSRAYVALVVVLPTFRMPPTATQAEPFQRLT